VLDQNLSKIKYASQLAKKRGWRWVAVSAIGELPYIPGLVGRLANSMCAQTPGFLVALAGVRANQLWADRKQVMERVAREFLTKPSNVLEVGTWMGKGSTQVWIQLLPARSSLTVLDLWKQYVASNEQIGATARMDSMHHVAINSTLRSIYRAESEGRLAISLIRADSKSFLPLLNDNSFDLIYLDGSHYYADVKADLQQAKRLIRDGGLICGDDLDLAPTPELIELARTRTDQDFVLLDDGRAFHPGVMLATVEELKSVQCENASGGIAMIADCNH